MRIPRSQLNRISQHAQKTFDTSQESSSQSQPLHIDVTHLPPRSLPSSYATQPAFTKHCDKINALANGSKYQFTGSAYTNLEKSGSSWRFFKTYQATPSVQEQKNKDTTGQRSEERKKLAVCKQLGSVEEALRDIYAHIDKLDHIPELKGMVESFLKKAEKGGETKDMLCKLQDMSDHLNLQSKMIECLLSEQSKAKAQMEKRGKNEMDTKACQTSPVISTVSTAFASSSDGQTTPEITEVKNRSLVPAHFTDKSVHPRHRSRSLQIGAIASKSHVKQSSSRYLLRSAEKKAIKVSRQRHCTGTRRSPRLHKPELYSRRQLLADFSSETVDSSGSSKSEIFSDHSSTSNSLLQVPEKRYKTARRVRFSPSSSSKKTSGGGRRSHRSEHSKERHRQKKEKKLVPKRFQEDEYRKQKRLAEKMHAKSRSCDPFVGKLHKSRQMKDNSKNDNLRKRSKQDIKMFSDEEAREARYISSFPNPVRHKNKKLNKKNEENEFCYQDFACFNKTHKTSKPKREEKVQSEQPIQAVTSILKKSVEAEISFGCLFDED
ncbi:peptidyl-prolyl cis-trans isomerase G-like [Watersipora subatra]|uniref:peptidyl-prolyl cis-trans isomerase G-like n=1 Tax=Watersipora subatra TaxID=2589382 RepID=UPI00355B7E93